MTKEQINQFGKGCIEDIPDERDYQYEEMIFGASPIVDWEKGFDVEDLLNHKFKIESQGTSLSCVGQAWSKYLEILNYAEESKEIDLSAAFIYSQIYLPKGGAQLRDGAKIAIILGCATEDKLPSYHYEEYQPRPLQEPEFREQKNKITDDVKQNAIIYQSLSYGSIRPDIDLMADAIHRNYGAITGAVGSDNGWKGDNGEVRPPLDGEEKWGHAIYLKGYGQDSKGKYIKFKNSWGISWGNNGEAKIYEDYFKTGNMFCAWTLIDKKNINSALMIDTIKLADKPEIYAKSKTDNKIFWVGGWESYQRMLKAGWIKEPVVVNSLGEFEIVFKPFGWIE